MADQPLNFVISQRFFEIKKGKKTLNYLFMYLLFLFCFNYWKVFSAGPEFWVGSSFLPCREHAAHCVLASAAGDDTPSLRSMFSVPCVFSGFQIFSLNLLCDTLTLICNSE